MENKEFLIKLKQKYLKAKKSKYSFYYILGILIFILILVYLIPSSRGIIYFHSNFNTKKVCKFTTVKAFYHNVGKTEEDAKGLGKIFFNYGYKKFWIEYDGTVDLNLNCDDIKITKVPFSNTVYVTLPKKITVDNPKVLGNTMSKGITDKGLFTKITEEEKKKAKSQAKQEMIKKAKEDTELHNYAMQRSKSLIEKYIISIGKLNHKEYKVVFK